MCLSYFCYPALCRIPLVHILNLNKPKEPTSLIHITLLLMETKIELILTNDNSIYQREIIVNGESVFFQRFDPKYMDKDDFIHKFSKVVLNGLRNESSNPSD